MPPLQVRHCAWCQPPPSLTAWNAKDLDDALSITRLHPRIDEPLPLSARDAIYEVRYACSECESFRCATPPPPPSSSEHSVQSLSFDAPSPWQIGVHIADVTYFLQPNTALDTVASRRATSVYLVQRVIPMLPSLLCEELCSLNPGVDRLAFTVMWRMRGDGTLVEHDDPSAAPWIGHTIIRSAAKLDYGTAQRMIDGTVSEAAIEDGSLSDELWARDRRPPAARDGATATSMAIGIVRDMRAMHGVAMARRTKRFQAGALALNKSKLSFTCDASGNPTGVTTYPVRESNRVVEGESSHGFFVRAL